MRLRKGLALLGLTALLLHLAAGAGVFGRLEARLREGAERGRMKNVTLTDPGEIQSVLRPVPEMTPAPTPKFTPAPLTAPAVDTRAQEDAPLQQLLESVPNAEIRETTISGGLGLRNETHYQLDLSALLRQGPPQRLPAEGPQILILHTHGSEAYTPAGLDRYEPNDRNRTDDTQCNVVRVGEELASRLSAAGLRVIHDREIYDYPSYTGSYKRSAEAVEAYLRDYPDIALVLDLHRDALGSDGVVYKTMAEEDGVVASQIMLLCGSDESGLEHPHWRENLALAMYLQEAIGRKHPTLLRPASLVPQRYNQHLSTGALILEVGSSGNTLQEALAAIRLFAEAAAPALQALVEGEGPA